MRTPQQMREDAGLWVAAGYPTIAVARYRDAADEIERLLVMLQLNHDTVVAQQREIARLEGRIDEQE